MAKYAKSVKQLWMTIRASMIEPLVSVVTPVRNTATYLRQCIESILSQKYQNWEYVIADNGSTDGSLEIANAYAAMDSRIRIASFTDVVDQVPNYNRALRLVSSAAAYVKVVEADNWIHPECLSEMVALGEAQPTVAVIGAYNITEKLLRLSGLPPDSTRFPGREIARRQLSHDIYVIGAPTTVMIRADLVRRRSSFYDETYLIAEDQSACIDLLQAGDFGFVHQVLTFVRNENDSILSKIKGFDMQYLDKVVLIHRHGRQFFGPQELDRITTILEDRYYERLAYGWWKRQSLRFWDFHVSGLRSIGLDLRRTKLFLAIGRIAARRALGRVLWTKPPV